MNLRRTLSVAAMAAVSAGMMLFIGACVHEHPSVSPIKPVAAAPPITGSFVGTAVATTPPVYVPDTSHENDPLPPNILGWDSISKETNAAADAANAHFNFSFTNLTTGKVAILNVHPSCGCTTAQLPPLPWILASGVVGQIPITVNLAGKSGTIFKSVRIGTDKGSTQLMLKIDIRPPAPLRLSDAERARGLEMAKVDRQAVFRGECATCHVYPSNGKYGQALYNAACGICHEAEPRATMVPDLRTLKTPDRKSVV